MITTAFTELGLKKEKNDNKYQQIKSRSFSSRTQICRAIKR